MNARIAAVIFDMDGLMLDTEPIYKAAWQRAAIECGHPISEELYAHLIGRTRLAGENILREAFGPQFSIENFRAACARCETDAFAENLPAVKPGLEDLLAFLDERGMPKAIATSTERPIAERQLSGLNLLRRFDIVVTGDEVVNGKPCPDMFLLTAQRLNIPPRLCLVLEDSEAGILAAHRAGMPVYVVPDLKPPAPSLDALADGRFDSLVGVERRLRMVLDSTES